MEELEQELEIARKQADIERARAEAVTSHLATENQQLRSRQAPVVQRPVPRRSRASILWRLAGHLVGRMGSLLLSLISCLGFLLLLLLLWAYWPEIASLLRPENLPLGSAGS